MSEEIKGFLIMTVAVILGLVIYGFVSGYIPSTA